MSQASKEVEYENSDPRRDVHIDSGVYDLFTDLKEKSESPFVGVENHDLFMFTVGYGRQHGEARLVEEDEHAFFGRSRLSKTQETVIEAVAVKEEQTVEVLRDQRKVYKIAEMYANGGVELLHGYVFTTDDDSLSELTLEANELFNHSTDDLSDEKTNVKI